MNFRLWLNVGGIVALLIINFRLIASDVHDSIEKTSSKLLKDQLVDLQYTKTNRPDNFAKYGLSGKLINRALKKASKYSREKDKVLALLIKASDKSPLISQVFCQNSSEHRPRYGGMYFLVEQQKERRRTINFLKTSSLKTQTWAQAISIVSLYRQIEFVDNPDADSTLRYAAAMLLSKEEDLQNGVGIWSRSRWDWAELQSQKPNIGLAVADYFALMHVFTEIAQSQKGICGQQ